jgi:hypothetical protein
MGTCYGCFGWAPDGKIELISLMFFSCSSSKYLSHMVLTDQETKLKWNLVNVYGASKYSEKVLS